MKQATRLLRIVLPCTLLAIAVPANAELYRFTYTFNGTQSPPQTYAPGSQLTGYLDGVPDPGNPDRVIITSFGAVSLLRTGLPKFDFPSVENDEFNTFPDGGIPVVTFSGAEINFRACPSGFTLDIDLADGILDDCPFAFEGGFVIDTSFNGTGIVTTADGSGEAAPCWNFVDRNTLGCRVTDRPMIGTWSLTLINAAVDPSVDLDPTASVGDGAVLDRDVTVEENVVVGEGVRVDRGATIGAGSSVGTDSSLDRDVTLGENVQVGENVSIDAEGVIQSDVVTGDDVQIDRGALICSGVTIGESAQVGRNALVDSDVPATGEVPGSKSPPGSCP